MNVNVDSVKTTGRPGILFVCHECDALQKVPAVEPGHDATCVRCKSRLFRSPKGGIDKPLALVMASLVIFVVANLHPIMTLDILGIKINTTITGAAYIFMRSGSPELAAIVWLPSVLLPGLILCGLFYVLFSIRFRKNWRYTRSILVWISRLLPWGMMDVFLLGILVSLVKLVGLADVVIDLGFYAFFLVVVLYAATMASLEPHTLWEALKDEKGNP